MGVEPTTSTLRGRYSIQLITLNPIPSKRASHGCTSHLRLLFRSKPLSYTALISQISKTIIPHPTSFVNNFFSPSLYIHLHTNSVGSRLSPSAETMLVTRPRSQNPLIFSHIFITSLIAIFYKNKKNFFSGEKSHFVLKFYYLLSY